MIEIESKLSLINEIYKECSLPDKADKEHVNMLAYTMRDKFYQ